MGYLEFLLQFYLKNHVRLVKFSYLNFTPLNLYPTRASVVNHPINIPISTHLSIHLFTAPALALPLTCHSSICYLPSLKKICPCSPLSGQQEAYKRFYQLLLLQEIWNRYSFFVNLFIAVEPMRIHTLYTCQPLQMGPYLGATPTVGRARSYLQINRASMDTAIGTGKSIQNSRKLQLFVCRR